jgi:integrase
MAKKLTKLSLDAIQPPAKGQVDHWDDEVTGLGLRVSFGGKKSWTLMYRHNGLLRRMTIGPYPTIGLSEARRQARQLLLEAATGQDPARRKQEARRAESFGDLTDLYIEKHAKPMKRTWREDQRMINAELLPRWKNLKPGDISRRDVIRLLDAIVDRGSPVQANRVRALISKIYNFAIRRGIVEANPAYMVENPGVEKPRDRVLSEDEIRALWIATQDEGRVIFDAFRLGLLTAQRRGEIIGMSWDEVDLKAGWWTIAAERSKNRLAHRVPLGTQAIRILRERRNLDDDSRYVFPTRFHGKGDAPTTEIQKVVNRVRKDSGIDFVFHDLRRTAATCMTAIGISRLVVSKVLNHVERGITAVYDRHSYDSDKRDAIERWDVRLQQILTPEASESANVVPLRSSRTRKH